MSYSRSDEGTHKNISLQIKKKNRARNISLKTSPVRRYIFKKHCKSQGSGFEINCQSSAPVTGLEVGVAAELCI